MTVDPENLILERMQAFQWLAARPDQYQEDYENYRANYFNHLSVLRHRVSNEIWQRLAFDSEGLEQELNEVATHLLWLGITARSWEFHISHKIAAISQALERLQMDEDGQWDGDWDLVVGELEKLAVLHSLHAGRWAWRLEKLTEHELAVRARVQEFLTARKDDQRTGLLPFHDLDNTDGDGLDEDGSGFEKGKLGAFYTLWFKGLVELELALDGDKNKERTMEGEFWRPDTKGRMFLVKEMSLVVDDLERRWEVVNKKILEFRESLERKESERPILSWARLRRLFRPRGPMRIKLE
jgi:hypothetical protein